MKKQFRSALAADLNGMRKWRSALGRREDSYDYYLHKLDEFCCEFHPEANIVTWDLAVDYLSKEHEHTDIHMHVATLRNLAKYQIMRGKDACVFPCHYFSRRQYKMPYIMSDDDLRRFFWATDHYPSDSRFPLQEYTAATIFRLQYAAGLRPQEVRLLDRADFDFSKGTIYIANAKHHKDRLLPIDNALMEMCKRYDAIARSVFPNATCFFPNTRGQRIHVNGLSRLFRICWKMSGNPTEPGYCSPYILRHNFATRRLTAWLEEGRDIDAVIPYLSAYMGHDGFHSTYYYIHLLPEHLVKSGLMDVKGVIPEVHHED